MFLAVPNRCPNNKLRQLSRHGCWGLGHARPVAGRPDRRRSGFIPDRFSRNVGDKPRPTVESRDLISRGSVRAHLFVVGSELARAFCRSASKLAGLRATVPPLAGARGHGKAHAARTRGPALHSEQGLTHTRQPSHLGCYATLSPLLPQSLTPRESQPRHFGATFSPSDRQIFFPHPHHFHEFCPE